MPDSTPYVWTDNEITIDDNITVSLSQSDILQSTVTMVSSGSTYNPSYTNIGIGAVGSSGSTAYTIGTNSNWNGTFTIAQAKLAIDSEDDKVIFKTKEHTVDWDEFVNDVHQIKRAFMKMSNNEELMEKYPEIRDMLAEWMIRGLSK